LNFKLVFEQLLKRFHEYNIRYALIGGFALGAQGVSRATIDIDFLVDRDDMSRVHAILCEEGYERRYQSENVSMYISPLKVFGEVDFLHAFREISVNMLQRAREMRIFDGSITVKVVEVEDLIGLKVQAMANDESRRTRDLADIESLIEMHQSLIDWDRVENYFSLFRFEDLFSQLKRKYNRVE
jgi:predicted nucleotidyltransferase